MNKAMLAILLGTIVLLAVVVLGMYGISRVLPFERTTVRGSGNVVEETRDLDGITGVNLATIGHLTTKIGEPASLRIKAEDNLMPYLQSEKRGGKLTIRTVENVRLDPTQPIKYILTTPHLEMIEISSAGDIDAPDLEAEQFSISINSSGDLVMGDLETDSLQVKIASSGDVRLGTLSADGLEVDISSTGSLDIAGGAVRTQDVNISSAGDYTAPDLASDEAEVRLSSDGSATLWVQEQLKATLNSSGDLRYRGNPTVDASTNSSGELVQID